MTDADVAGFERLARPLLELIQRVTGLETTFVTQIDWASQQQEIVFALNTADLEVTEGSVRDWSETVCRRMLLSSKEHTSDAVTDLPGSLAVEIGMHTVFVVPITADDAILGTVCGGSRQAVDLDPDAMAIIRLVAESMTFQMSLLVEARVQRERAEQAEVHALTDPLTQLANRRAFSARFEEELARSGHERLPVALLIMDVDSFKAVNDTYGHGGGDMVLQALGEVLRRTVRSRDVPARLADDQGTGCVSARLGGDEFALLLPQGSAGAAATVAARIAAEFGRATGELGMPCTLSIGISTTESAPLAELLDAADEALYRNKASGRDRTMLWSFCA